MRIGLITHNYYYPADGSKNAGIFIYELAQKLAKLTTVRVLPVARDITAPLASWNPLDPRSIVAFGKLMATGTAAGRKFVKDHSIDYLLAMWALPAGLICYRLHKEFGIPYAVFSLGSDINYYSKLPILRPLIKNSLTHADVRFANSKKLSRDVIRLSNLPCRYVPTATNFPLAGIKPVTLNKKYFHFLYVGRLEKVKGVDILVDACGLLHTQLKNFHVHVIGDGTLRAWAEKEIARHKLKNCVSFLGNKNQSDVARYMLGVDSLVIPSRSENLPLVLGEAAKCSLPIISTDVGVCSMVRTYHAGLLVPANNPPKLARAMQQLAAQGRGAKKIYAPGLARIAKKFDPNDAPHAILTAILKSIYA
jgi:glycosyltransferase involved in cell wall biosynthesis